MEFHYQSPDNGLFNLGCLALWGACAGAAEEPEHFHVSSSVAHSLAGQRGADVPGPVH